MIDYTEDWFWIKLLFSYRGSVAHRAALFALPGTLLTLGFLIMDDIDPEIRLKANLMDHSTSTLWSAGTVALIFVIGFRTNRAIMRFWEGTGLLHQMRGEWFDTVSNCVSFSIKSSRKRDMHKKVMEFRHTLVRLMSLAHGYALEEISGNEFEIGTIDVYGLDRSTRTYLKENHEKYHFNKVEMTLHLIQTLIVNANLDEIIDVPAPILSRVFQTISRGFVHLLNTKKITDTKFPFPYTQLIAILLFWFSAFTPMLISSFIVNKTLAALCTFVPIFSMAGLNFVAIEVENPFGSDDNDLPMFHFQSEMDSCLLMLLHPFADTVPTVGTACITDFGELFERYGDEGKEKEEPDEEKEQKEEQRRLSNRPDKNPEREGCASPDHMHRRWNTKKFNESCERSREMEMITTEKEDKRGNSENANETCDTSKVSLTIEAPNSAAPEDVQAQSHGKEVTPRRSGPSEAAPATCYQSEADRRQSAGSQQSARSNGSEASRQQCPDAVKGAPPQHCSVEVQTVAKANVEIQTDRSDWVLDTQVDSRIAAPREDAPMLPRIIQLGQQWSGQGRGRAAVQSCAC